MTMVNSPPTSQTTDLPKEFSFIRDHFGPLAGPAALGLRDDAAVFTPAEGRDLVVAVDTMVENVHFLPDDPPETIGRKLLRCNLSDLAAMGSKPEGWLLAFSRPAHITNDWTKRFCEGLHKDQEAFGLRLMGGDTTSTSGPLVLSLTILGSVAHGQAIRRQGAKAGDGIWVTGTIGDGALGLQALQGKLEDPTGWLAEQYRLPRPRVGLPLFGLASAAMDVSDGLVQDCGHLARENSLHAVLHARAVPLSPSAQAAGGKWLPTCLTGGDDYEILMAVPPEHEAKLATSGMLDTPHGAVPVTRIGTFTNGSHTVTVLEDDETPLTFPTGGWSHL